MSPDRSNEGGRKPPPRPRTPVDYIPTPVRIVAPAEAFGHLQNEKQRSTPARFHSFSRGRLTSPTQTRPGTPNTMKNSFIGSARTGRSALSAARRSIASGLEKAKPAVGTAVAASKKAAITAADRLKGMAANTSQANKKDKQKGKEVNRAPKSGNNDQRRGSASSSELSTISLRRRRRLPKLQIPNIDVAVAEALKSACSTDTEESENFRLLEISPTSRELKDEWLNDDHPLDVQHEFHNMLSARRRVRKGKKFGAIVKRYCEARSTWRDAYIARAGNDNYEDRELLKVLTDALQEQKDLAVRLVQQNPAQYPGLKEVSDPGVTLKLYWQHKSTVPVREKGWLSIY